MFLNTFIETFKQIGLYAIASVGGLICFLVIGTITDTILRKLGIDEDGTTHTVIMLIAVILGVTVGIAFGIAIIANFIRR